MPRLLSVAYCGETQRKLYPDGATLANVLNPEAFRDSLQKHTPVRLSLSLGEGGQRVDMAATTRLFILRIKEGFS